MGLSEWANSREFYTKILLATQSQLDYYAFVISANCLKPLSGLNLCEVRCGQLVRVREIRSEPSVCLRLKEMGFCEFAEIHKIADNGALLCQVCGVRVALSRRLASQIYVETVDK